MAGMAGRHSKSLLNIFNENIIQKLKENDWAVWIAASAATTARGKANQLFTLFFLSISDKQKTAPNQPVFTSVFNEVTLFFPVYSLQV
ncbi:MAG: hypothetical protein Q8K36_04435 [Alphaproteobacteria bacterium]|nr:hypothetical protein [Alphaproteobacteria bacterium]